MADAGTITVKLILDTTQFDRALERVKAELSEALIAGISFERS